VKTCFLLRALFRLAVLAGAGIGVLVGTGCATNSETAARFPQSPEQATRVAANSAVQPVGLRSSVAATTGRVFTKAEMHQLTTTHYFGDEVYAEVNSQWLRQYYQEFRSELHRLGVMEWDERFDCNRFTELYVGLAQARFFRETFHSRTPARALAIGPFWYVRDNGRGSHAVVQALTERGRIFIDPQSGEEVQLTTSESTTFAYFQFF
jgi:hypothetical protein